MRPDTVPPPVSPPFTAIWPFSRVVASPARVAMTLFSATFSPAR